MEQVNNIILELFLKSSGVNTDTRSIKDGDLFFALKGDNFNGNVYAKSALDQGALAVVIDEIEYKVKGDDRFILVTDVLLSLQNLAKDYRMTFDIPVIGLTGSNGKTTTKELLKAVLSRKFKVHATSGNFNNHIGVPLTILSAKKDTEILLIEMGANFKGEIQELCDMSLPNFGLITNISKAHLEGFGDFSTIVETKTAMYRYLIANNGTIFINGEDELLLDQIEERCVINKYFPSKLLSVYESTPNITWTYINNDELLNIPTNLVGEYNRPNLAVVIAIGEYFDIPVKRIIEALSEYVPSNNRSQLKILGTNKYILDAYNANPTSMKLGIENMINISAEHKVLILGDMLELGDFENQAHQEIVDMIANSDWMQVYLVGAIFSKTNISKNMMCFDNVNHLKDFLDNNPLNDATILLKGSRGIALEKIII